MKSIKSLKVLSTGDGNMTIQIKYKKAVPGVIGRMAIARQIQKFLDKKMNK